jgi:hypothetical protein
MNKKQAIKLCDALNGVIHSRNLYRRGRRYFNAHVIGNAVWVEDLNAPVMAENPCVPFDNDGSFVDGYAQPVLL